MCSNELIALISLKISKTSVRREKIVADGVEVVNDVCIVPVVHELR